MSQALLKSSNLQSADTRQRIYKGFAETPILRILMADAMAHNITDSSKR